MLTFNLKKKWFDKIKSGEKTHEYRIANEYWTKRLYNCIASTDFKVCFCLGYPRKDDMTRRLYGNILGLFYRTSGMKTDLKTAEPVWDIHFKLIEPEK